MSKSYRASWVVTNPTDPTQQDTVSAVSKKAAFLEAMVGFGLGEQAETYIPGADYRKYVSSFLKERGLNSNRFGSAPV